MASHSSLKTSYNKWKRRKNASYIHVDGLGECLLISTLPTKVLRMLVELQGLSSNLTCGLKAEPGKPYIKRHEPCILFISLKVGSLLK